MLSLSLFPTKATAILFGTFFGYYPVIKLAAERLPHPVLRWGIKLAVFDLVMVLLWLTVRSVFQVEGGILSSYPVVMVIAANAAFVLYDLALGQGILFYIRKIARRIE